MYKNNFDEVFERVYGDPVFSRYTRQRRVSIVVKWAGLYRRFGAYYIYNAALWN